MVIRNLDLVYDVRIRMRLVAVVKSSLRDDFPEEESLEFPEVARRPPRLSTMRLNPPDAELGFIYCIAFMKPGGAKGQGGRGAPTLRARLSG